MEEKVKCNDCGALVLPDTANRTGGLCMPCKNGTRKSMDVAKKSYAKEREFDKTCPYRALWQELVEKVHKTEIGFNSLTEEEKQYFAVNLLSGDVYNGGFNQYFFNSSSDYYKFAELGLIRIGATESLKLARRAKKDFFGSTTVPASQEHRWALIRQHEVEPELDDYDTEFYKDLDDLDIKLERFAKECGLVKAT
jgi:hypothetical protein